MSHINSYSESVKQTSSQHITIDHIDNNIINYIFELSNIKCHTCMTIIKSHTLHHYKKYNNKYFCSSICYNHI